MRTPERPRLIVTILLVLTTLIGCDSPSPPKQLTVFAAASTTNVMQEAGKRFEAQQGIKVVFSFDSSSNLAKQIKAGAPADMFISADNKWMDDVASAGELRAGTRQNLLANELVMVAPIGASFEVKVTKEFDFSAALPQVKRIAVADPSHVPAGRYTQQALEWLGWWPALRGLLIPAQDVRAALRLVEIGEADAGIVYATDAQRSSKVVVVARFPSESHEPIHYPIVLGKNAAPEAEAFLQFLRSAEATSIFQMAGFTVLPTGAGR